MELSPELDRSLKRELNMIQDALLKIDFQIVDDDKQHFYTYVLNDLYDMKIDYVQPDFRPPKYFKILLKEIKTAINWDPDFVFGGLAPQTDN